MHNSDLYKEEGIALYENWLHNYNEALTGDIETTDDEDVVLTENKQISEETSQNDEDEWSEDEANIYAGVTDTLLTPPDFADHNEQQCILNLAPAEGSMPLSAFRDEYSEELAYPGIFLGQKRPGQKDRLV